jgi:putative membrane protein
MQIFLIFSFVIAFFAILFAIQNTTVTPIRFLFWETEGSLALVLFIALAAGALISYLVTAPGQIRQRMTISSQRKRIAEVEEQLTNTQNELQTTKEQLQQVEAMSTSGDEEIQAEESPPTDEEITSQGE